MLPLGASTPPAWVYSGAALDLDFANQRYYGASIDYGNSTITSSRVRGVLSEVNSGAVANTLLAPDINGVYRSFPQYGLRITNGRGLWIENQATNYCFFSRTYTDATWVKTNVTATQNQIGIDGKANTGTLLTANAPGAIISQAVTMTSADAIYSLFLKRSAGTGTIGITLDGSTSTDISGQLNSTTFTQVFLTHSTLVNPTIGLIFGTSGDAVVADHSQLEKTLNSMTSAPTTPIITTGAATNTRGIEEAFFNNATVPDGYNDGWRFISGFFTAGPISALIVGDGYGTAGCLITGVDIGWQFTGAFNGGNLKMVGTLNGSVTTSSNTGNFGLGNTNKCAFSMGGGSTTVFLNGVATINTGGHFSNSANTHGGIGNNGSGNLPLNGPVQRATYWPRELATGEGIIYTT